jgi:hypothetical protein
LMGWATSFGLKIKKINGLGYIFWAENEED